MVSPSARNAAGGADQPPEVVPPTGFEPVISTLKGWRPRPLDDGGQAPGECSRGLLPARAADRTSQADQTRARTMAAAKQPAESIAATPPPSASSTARLPSPWRPAR